MINLKDTLFLSKIFSLNFVKFNKKFKVLFLKAVFNKVCTFEET